MDVRGVELLWGIAAEGAGVIVLVGVLGRVATVEISRFEDFLLAVTVSGAPERCYVLVLVPEASPYRFIWCQMPSFRRSRWPVLARRSGPG